MWTPSQNATNADNERPNTPGSTTPKAATIDRRQLQQRLMTGSSEEEDDENKSSHPAPFISISDDDEDTIITDIGEPNNATKTTVTRRNTKTVRFDDATFHRGSVDNNYKMSSPLFVLDRPPKIIDRSRVRHGTPPGTGISDCCYDDTTEDEESESEEVVVLKVGPATANVECEKSKHSLPPLPPPLSPPLPLPPLPPRPYKHKGIGKKSDKTERQTTSSPPPPLPQYRDEVVDDESDRNLQVDADQADIIAGNLFVANFKTVPPHKRIAYLKQNKGPDLTRGGRVSLSKALLGSAKNGMSGFQVYAKYFDPLTLVAADTNLSCIKRKRRMAFRVRASMYGRRFSREPAFFSFANHADINRLSTIVEKDIVIYYAKAGGDFESFFEIFHDFRLFSAASRRTSVTAECYSGRSRRTLSYVLTARGELFRFPPAWGLDICLSPWPFHLNAELGFYTGRCMARSLARIYGLPVPPVICENYIELQEHATVLQNTWKLPYTLLVVAYCRNYVDKCVPSKLIRRKQYSKCYYVTLAVLGAPLETSEDTVQPPRAADLIRQPMEAVKVAAFYADNRVGEVVGDHKMALISRFRACRQVDQLSDADYQSIPRMSVEQARIALALHRARKKRGRQGKCKTEWSGTKICECELCKSPEFQYNMNPAGPERLCTVQLDVTDLLEMLGANSPANLAIVDRLCELSVAAMDIEAMTVTVSLDQPESLFTYCPIDTVSLGGHVKQVQKPIMISHLDALGYEAAVAIGKKSSDNDDDDDNKCRLLTETARGDEECEIYAMMERYWKIVLERQRLTSEEKQRIAQPIFELVNRYSHAHMSFFRYWSQTHGDGFNTTTSASTSGTGGRGVPLNDGPSEMEATWKQSVPGKLEKALRTLIRDYQIFSFYGSGYDHVLLESYLVPHLFERNHLPKMEKRGNKVTLIKTRDGIVFRDVCKLLAPSTNLRNFGKLFGFEQEKAYFPFGLLTSVDALNIARLPTDVDEWKSELTGAPSIGETEIAEAQRLFAKAGCTNLGDYLRTYLKLDVLILYRATQEWRRHLKRLINVDFVECHKFTISSLSNLAGGRSLVQRRQLGVFFPNNSQTYRLLRQGMRGGLCSIYRPKAGQFQENGVGDDDDDEEYYNNSHWLNRPSGLPSAQHPDYEYMAQPSNHVLYYDAASLYPSSELSDMPVGTGTLYVGNPDHSKLFVRERRARNCTETNEAQVVQYLALHGHRQWTRRYGEAPDRVISSIHAGPGQQVFGSSRNQRCDLLLCFKRDPSAWTWKGPGIPWNSNAALLFYHNFHGSYYHYSGHATTCPTYLCQRSENRLPLQFDEETERFDEFRKAYSTAMTMVRPSECVFQYTTSLECDYFHGGVVHFRSFDLKRTGRLAVVGNNVADDNNDDDSDDDDFGQSTTVSPWNDWIDGRGRVSQGAPDSFLQRSASWAQSRLKRNSNHQETEINDSNEDDDRSQIMDEQAEGERRVPPDLFRDSLAELLCKLSTHSSIVRANDADGYADKVDIILRSEKAYYSSEELIAGITTGRLTGFVTLTGGRETLRTSLGTSSLGDAQDRFGFCVQRYRPNPELGEISEVTMTQIAEYYGWDLSTDAGRKCVVDYLLAQPARTLNSGTFHSTETISTTYLQWLIRERGFVDFTITHFLHYLFASPSRAFLEPILQSRHECKQRGEIVAAECLKLIVNGSYGYNGLEAINYDETRLLTDERLKRVRSTLMAHLTLKHITMIGVIRRRDKRKQKKKTVRQRRPNSNYFLSAEAEEAGVGSDEEEDDEEVDAGVNEDNDDDDNDIDADGGDGSDDDNNTEKNKQIKGVTKTRPLTDSADSDFEELHDLEGRVGSSSSEDDDDRDSESGDSTASTVASSDGGTRHAEATGDLEEQAIKAAEEHNYAICNRLPNSSSRSAQAAVELRKRKRKKADRYRYHFLYAVTVSAADKQIKNALHRAVAVLSNSKRLFLGHIRLLLECLDPGLAEICYIDTDSVIFSTTHRYLEQCLRDDKRRKFAREDIIADEHGQFSCHGRMKLEGRFAAGKFRALKVYRLYETVNAAQTDEQLAQNAATFHGGIRATYTRCKGVNKWLATLLPENAFDAEFATRLVVHRTCLRPSRSGEMTVAHEARSMTAPFNLKRLVAMPKINDDNDDDNNTISSSNNTDDALIRGSPAQTPSSPSNVAMNRAHKSILLTSEAATPAQKVIERSYHTFPLSFADRLTGDTTATTVAKTTSTAAKTTSTTATKRSRIETSSTLTASRSVSGRSIIVVPKSSASDSRRRHRSIPEPTPPPPSKKRKKRRNKESKKKKHKRPRISSTSSSSSTTSASSSFSSAASTVTYSSKFTTDNDDNNSDNDYDDNKRH